MFTPGKLVVLLVMLPQVKVPAIAVGTRTQKLITVN